MAADRGGEVRGDGERDDEASHEAYFEELNDGCGCAEIWEYLSDRRRRE
jgi:hypothetical protein